MREQEHQRGRAIHHHDKHAAHKAGHRPDDPHGVTAMSAEEEEAQADYQVSVHLEEERAESRNREYERDEFLNGLTNSNWAELRGEDESAEYELGVHLEEERMKEGR